MTSQDQFPVQPNSTEPTPPQISIPAETLALFDERVAQVSAYLNGEGPIPNKIFANHDAYSKAGEAERNYLVDSLGETLGVDVDARLTAYEEGWRAAGGRFVVLEPYVCTALGIDNPQAARLRVGNATERRAWLGEGAQPSLCMYEVEVQNTLRTEKPDGSITETPRVLRAIYFLED